MMISRCCSADVFGIPDEKGELIFECGKCGEGCEPDTDLKFVPESRHSAPSESPIFSRSPGDARKGRGPSREW